MLDHGSRIASAAGFAVRSSRPPPSHSVDPHLPSSSLSPQPTAAMPTATDNMAKPLDPPTIKTPTSSTRPTLPALITPSSATFPESAKFPSQMPRSPLSGDRLEVIKQEDEDPSKTPLTTPTAYTDFLKLLSPAVSTPSTSRSPLFDKALNSSGLPTPLTQPGSAAIPNSPLKTCSSAPLNPRSPYSMRPPASARSLRTPSSVRPRLSIPQSPVWSPATDSPRSSTLRSAFSPADWSAVDAKRKWCESPKTTTATGSDPVCVKQVIKRTITMTRSPVTSLDPAPKGKKRKLGEKTPTSPAVNPSKT